jgi:serine/threonine protein phosphatase 1
MLIHHVEKNTLGRDFVIGDIHGCFTEVKRLMKEVNFDKKADRLFSVGDLVDRGDESEDVLKWLNKPWFYAVRGNHDQMAIDWVNRSYYDSSNYRRNGGEWFMELPAERQNAIAKAFETLPLAIDIKTETGLVGIIHAECVFRDWNDVVTLLEDLVIVDIWSGHCNAFLWGRDVIRQSIVHDIANVDLLIHGHSVVTQKYSRGNRLYIDTGYVYDKKNLTMVEIH